MNTTDKEIERDRYDRRSRLFLSENKPEGKLSAESGLPAALNAPYQCFESQIKAHIVTSVSCLEIGAGSGVHTGALLETGAFVTATDISEASLKILRKRYKNVVNLETQLADMESLPFASGQFDAVVCAGSLSYGDNQIVMDEIYRVLKEGGVFIAVDSLNHNPIYRLNRRIHYLRGDRTLSTLKRMATIPLTEAYGNTFGDVEVHYFGTISWLIPLLGKLFNEEKVADICNYFDKMFTVKRSAFKFVMVVKKVK